MACRSGQGHEAALTSLLIAKREGLTQIKRRADGADPAVVATASLQRRRFLLRMLNSPREIAPQHGASLEHRCDAAGRPERPFSLLFQRSFTMKELRTLEPFGFDLFESPFRSLMRPWGTGLPDAAPRIKIDLSEQDGKYAVKAEIPGVQKEDIDVRVDGNMVTISAELRSDTKEKANGGRVLRRERQEGYASRSFTLACPVDEAKVQASYKNGILELTLPKKADVSQKRIAIQ
ncbi:Hsp20/alpha crystallin family protein [Hydrogenophaga sp. BPS33]|uniref:Hsp20/alpha crystallin family protein n=1 Tax=Hydrogenophaga sp. BPS33 TaxID=2651974 RepID=UPI00131FBE9D|nr:Hsp20/alpha crystallin family protein [Hydrogenophaga sp. BPS33]QHE86127.1 Hsp20/alpha crystallin family protein [Hydrogenophaga sp. BPS33]